MNAQVIEEKVVLVLRVGGNVDPESVAGLRARIDALEGPGSVVIDLCDARHVEHLALAMLAEDATRRRAPRVVLRGLCEHHLRMLRYFGHALPSEPIHFAKA
jgi:anti-anti-sigma regulatory factor